MAIAPVPRVQVARDSFFERLRKDWGYKIGRIYDLQTTPCHNNNFFIFVAAFFSSIPEAIASLNQFECTDQAWDKASNLWRNTHLRGGRRHGRGGTPELRGGEKQPKAFGPREAFGYAAFLGGNFLQRIGAKFLIIDTALDLGVNWMTLALEWNGCDVPPEIAGQATIGQQVYGCGGGTFTTGCAAQGPSVGVAFGIGGFITTVPTGNLDAKGNVSTGQFLTRPYFPLAGSNWLIFKTSTSELLIATEDNKVSQSDNPAQGLDNAYAWSNVTIPNVVGMNGTLACRAPACDDGGGIFTDSLVFISGERKGFLFDTQNPDPCKNLPLAGGIGPRR